MNKADLLIRLRDRLTHPASAEEILRVLRVPRLERPAAKRLLRELVADGGLVRVRGHLYALPRPASVHRAERPPRPLLARAVGRFERDRAGQAYLVPFDPRAIDEVLIPRAETGGAEPGQMVRVEITRHGAAGQPPRGSVTDVIGSLDEPGVDTEVILRKYEIPDTHGDEALQEAARVAAALGSDDLSGRTDFRDRIVVTIDGEHARDFDDAISIERLPNGHFWLGVHIADVAHYVRAGSALDREAYERATSVYFAERAVHMFPEALATGVCSLNPQVDRLVQSCLMEVNARGEVVRHEIHDGVIRSTARMTYTAVNAILTDRDPAMTAQYRDLVPTFGLMREMFEVLNRRRRRRGSVDFDLPEAEVVLDTEGLVADIIASERNVAHRLIEEFMLLANETVAHHLEDDGMPSLYRVHEPPDALKVEAFETFVRSLGYSLGVPPSGGVRPAHFQALVEQIRGAPAERPIAFLMLRTMQKARYDSVNLGHFGLAASCYTHFTSPIRRYPDLVVHRLLRELRHTRVDTRRRQALDAALPETGRHASERERRADEAERELLQWKKVRFMAQRVGDVFDGYVTGVTHFGLFVELVDHYVEGLVHISTLADDFYRFFEGTHTLAGERTKKAYRLGDHVKVIIARVDMDRRQIELALEKALDTERVRAPRTRAAAGTRSKSAQHKAAHPRRRAQRAGRRERSDRKRR
ncbi:MAG TPA: ribonuclease R [Vicinamibacterales bacterium]|nr:ribonuclease R [Vicinamibacterales bacterium]